MIINKHTYIHNHDYHVLKHHVLGDVPGTSQHGRLDARHETTFFEGSMEREDPDGMTRHGTARKSTVNPRTHRESRKPS